MVLKVIRALTVLALAFFISSTLRASTLQEGWYKIVSGGQHIGYFVQRFEFDEKKKQFVSTSYTYANAMGGGVKESLIAVATDKLEPVSYQFTSQAGSVNKVIDASFKKGIMTAKVTENQTPTGIQNKLQKGTFLSQFLAYVILQSKQGFKVGNNFSYTAIAEEDGQPQTGEAVIQGTDKYMGIEVYKIFVTFKNTRYVNYVTPKGIVLMTKSPTQSLSTELVASSADATKGMEVNQKTLNLLFKTLPAGGLPEGATPTASAAINIDPGKMGAPEAADPQAGLESPPGKQLAPANAKAPTNPPSNSKGQ